MELSHSGPRSLNLIKSRTDAKPNAASRSRASEGVGKERLCMSVSMESGVDVEPCRHICRLAIASHSTRLLTQREEVGGGESRVSGLPY